MKPGPNHPGDSGDTVDPLVARLMLPEAVTPVNVAEAVRVFDERYGDMEKTMWYLAKATREDLLRGDGSVVVQTLVWTIKSWWAVQGVTRQIKMLAAQALPNRGRGSCLMRP